MSINVCSSGTIPFDWSINRTFPNDKQQNVVILFCQYILRIKQEKSGLKENGTWKVLSMNIYCLWVLYRQYRKKETIIEVCLLLNIGSCAWSNGFREHLY